MEEFKPRNCCVIVEGEDPSPIDTGGLSDRLDGAGADGKIPAACLCPLCHNEIRYLWAELIRLRSIAARSTIAASTQSVIADFAECRDYWFNQTFITRAELNRVLATSVPVHCVLDDSATCVRPWVAKADAAQAELNRLSSQLADSVPVQSVVDGSAECVKPWVEKVDATRTELNRLSSQLAASVPIKSVYDGSAFCVKPWISKAKCARAELNRLSSQLADSVPVQSVVDGSAECVKPWVEKVDAARTELNRFSLQLADSVPVQSVVDGSAECVKPWVEKVDATRTELNRLSSQLAVSVPIKSVVDGSAKCVKPLVKKAEAARTELNRLSSQLAVSVPIKSVVDGSAKCVKPWVEKAEAVRAELSRLSSTSVQLDRRLRDQAVKIRNAKIESNHLRAKLTVTKAKLSEANDNINRLNTENTDLEEEYNKLTRLLRSKSGSLCASGTHTTLALMKLVGPEEFSRQPPLSSNCQPAGSTTPTCESTIPGTVLDCSLGEQLTQLQDALEDAQKRNRILLDRNRVLSRQASEKKSFHANATEQGEETTQSEATIAALFEEEKLLREIDKEVVDLKTVTARISEQWESISALNQSAAKMETRAHQIESQDSPAWPSVDLSDRIGHKLSVLRAVMIELHLGFSFIESQHLKAKPVHSANELESLRQLNSVSRIQVNDLGCVLTDCLAARRNLEAKIKTLFSVMEDSSDQAAFIRHNNFGSAAESGSLRIEGLRRFFESLFRG